MAIRTDFAPGEVLAAADVNDTFASKPTKTFGTAVPSSPVSGDLFFDTTDTPPTPKFFDGSVFQGIASPAGLEHINTTTFSAVSSVSINDVFTSTFENYLLKIIVTGSVANESLTTRFRASGVDTSTSTYIVQNLDANNTTVSAARNTQTSATISGVTSDHKSGIDVNLYSPQLAVVTAYSAFAAFSRVGALIKLHCGTQTDATQFDGITLFPVSGTMTGNIRVYGYKNS